MSETRRILALDCATLTGWAFSDGEQELSGVEAFPIPRGASIGMRWINFTAWARRMLATHQPDLLLFEKPFIASMRSATVAEIAFGMVTRLQELAEAAGVDYAPVQNSVLKQWATGKGNASKDAMILAAAEKGGQHIEDTLAHLQRPGGDNEADALLLLYYGKAGCPDVKASAEAAKARAQSFADAWTWKRDADPPQPRRFNGIAEFEGQRYSACLTESDGRWIALGRFVGGVLNCGLAQAKREVIKATWARLLETEQP